MQIEPFELERIQSLWENRVDYNLTESGVHPLTIREILSAEEIEQLLDLPLTYGWTNGEPELREAVARYYPGTDADNVLITNGSAEANFLAMWSLLEPGDEIVMMLPNYMQIWGLARALDVTIKPWRLRPLRRWQPELDELPELVNERTRLIVVCNPNNPTGSVLARREMERIVELAAGVGATVYADEVYKGVELEGDERPSFRDLDESAVVASGLSKALAQPGLRIGWLVGPSHVIAAAWHRSDYTTITTSRASEFIATRILEPGRRAEILERNRKMLRNNAAILQEWIASQNGLFSLIPPEAGGMALLRYSFDMNSTELATWLREHKSLLVLPGDVFGMDHYMRIGIGAPAEFLRHGLGLLAEGLRELGVAAPAPAAGKG